MAEKTLEITECDEAGNVTATYLQSAIPQDGMSRVDMIVRSETYTHLDHTTKLYLVTREHQITLAESVGCVPARWLSTLSYRRLPRVSVNRTLLAPAMPN